MMKIAIPLFDRRVSPRFDCAPDFLLASVENSEIVKRQELSASRWSRQERVEKLSELGVETLICGGNGRLSEGLLTFKGVKIYSWVSGIAEDGLRTFLRGQLESGINGRLRRAAAREVEIQRENNERYFIDSSNILTKNHPWLYIYSYVFSCVLI